MKRSFIGGFISVTLMIAAGFFALAATSRNAYGYVDPGSGLLALQSFASVMAAAGFFLRRRIKALFSGKSQSSAQENALRGTKTGSRNAA